MQTNLNLALPHNLPFLPNPSHWCPPNRGSANAKHSPFLTTLQPPPPFLSHRIHCKLWQFCLVYMYKTCIHECLFSPSPCLSISTFVSKHPLTVHISPLVHLIISSSVSYKKIPLRLLQFGYTNIFPMLSVICQPLPLIHETHVSLKKPHNVHHFWWLQYLCKWA